MKTQQLAPARVALLAVSICAALLVWSLTVPCGAFADDPPTAPPQPPTRTNTPTPTDTPEPTETLAPTDTPTPTDTPKTPDIPISTDTPVPSDTPVPTPTAAPTNTPRPAGPTGPQATSAPSSDCQSAVIGSVTDASGGPAHGATVLIERADWSDAMLTNDAGEYRFNQLCPGKASLQAFFVDGQVSQLAELELNGRDDVQIQLSVASAGAAAISESAATPEPDMPATGYTGWLLLGGALLAAFLLIVAGTRRAMTVRDRAGGRD